MSARQTHRFVMNCRLWRMLALPQMNRCFQHLGYPASAMRLLPTIILISLLATPPAAEAAPLPAPQQVEIALGSGTLRAQLYKRDGDGPFPTVIALHGCGGLGGHTEPIQPRYRDWAQQLLGGGNAVLL